MARRKKEPVVRKTPACRRGGICAPQWLQECAADTPRAMLCGQGYLAVENCGQVERFQQDCVCLMTAQGRMQIEGSALSISRESAHTAIVRGRIEKICLSGDA